MGKGSLIWSISLTGVGSTGSRIQGAGVFNLNMGDGVERMSSSSESSSEKQEYMQTMSCLITAIACTAAM